MARKFPIDMAGFAFDAQLLHGLQSPIWNHHGVGGESEFLEKLTQLASLIPLGDLGHGPPQKISVSHDDASLWDSSEPCA